MIAMLMLLLSQAPRDPSGYYVPPSDPDGVETCVVIRQVPVGPPPRKRGPLDGPWSRCGPLAPEINLCCPGEMTEDCCREWIVSGKEQRPACAVPQS